MAAVLETGWKLVQTTPGAISVVIDKPVGVVAGDLLVLIAALNDIPNAAPPAGFTEIANRSFNNVRIFVWAKIAGASEPANYTVSNINSGGSDQESVIFLGRVTGADTSGTAAAAFDASGTDTGQGTTQTCPSVTTTADDELVLVPYAKDRVYTGADADDAGNPTGTTIVYRRNSGGTSSTGVTGGLATFTQATAGATGAKTWTDAGNDKWVAATLAIKTAAGGGGATKLATGSLDAALAAARARTTGLGGALRRSQSATANLHAALAMARSIQAATDAALAREVTPSAPADAVLAATKSVLANLDGALGRLLVLGAGLDASLAGASGGLVHAELTAALRRVQAAALNLDGALGAARVQAAALDAVTGRAIALAMGLNAVLRARLQASAAMDAVIGRIFTPGAARTFLVPSRGGHAVPGDPRTFVIPPGNRRH